MSKYIKLIISAFILSVGLNSSAQCPRPHELGLYDPESGWSENSQSKSGLLKMGETYELNLIAQRGMDYRVSAFVATEDASDIFVDLKIYDSEVKKVEEEGRGVYKRVKKCIYDTSKSNPDDELVITTPKTRRLNVKVTAVNASKNEDVECVIIYVEHRRSQKLGFN